MTDPAPVAIVIGASGGIGRAVATAFLEDSRGYRVVTVSRSAEPPVAGVAHHFQSDYGDGNGDSDDDGEIGIASVAAKIRLALDGDDAAGAIERLVITNGVLHGDGFAPERSIKRLSRDAALRVLEANSVVPMLWLSAFADVFRKAPGLRIAVLSARVGSIGDNTLGGWYSYRASKAALNMMLKCAAIEFNRSNPSIKLVAFHPGTTDTALSQPFQKNVPAEKLFSPAFVASQLRGILDAVEGGGMEYLDWAGKPIEW